jgi:hypothetical protein
MNDLKAFLNLPVPIWFFGSLMYTLLWFLNYQTKYFRGAWRPAYHIIAWSMIIGIGVGMTLTGIFFWKFGLWITLRSLFYATIVTAIFTVILQKITTHFTMVIVSFFGWPYMAYIIGTSMFR